MGNGVWFGGGGGPELPNVSPQKPVYLVPSGGKLTGGSHPQLVTGGEQPSFGGGQSGPSGGKGQTGFAKHCIARGCALLFPSPASTLSDGEGCDGEQWGLPWCCPTTSAFLSWSCPSSSEDELGQTMVA